MNNNNNIFEQFESEGAFAPTKAGLLAGNAGIYLLYLAEIVILAYTGYHGISASLLYAGDGLAKIPQIAGIVIIELTMFSLSLAWHNNKVTSPLQTFVSVGGWFILLVITSLGVLGDSQIHAGYSMTGWLQVYLQWGLPIAPLLALVIVVLVTSLAPDKVQERKRANQLTAFSDATFDAFMIQNAALAKADLQIKSLQIGAQIATAKLIAEQINHPQVIAMIQSQAMANVPALLQSVGISLPYPLTQGAMATMPHDVTQSVTGTNTPVEAQNVTGGNLASVDNPPHYQPINDLEVSEDNADFLEVGPVANGNGRYNLLNGNGIHHK